MRTDAREERFRALYESVRPRVIAYALRRTASPEDAADVVAETFTIVWRRLEDVPTGELELLWCYATARRVVANHTRRIRRRDELIDRIGSELRPVLAGLVDESDADALNAKAALGRLGDDDRELLMLVGWEGLSSPELACVLQCSPTAARIRLHRARGRLRDEMAQLGFAAKQQPPSRHLSLTGPVPAKAPGKA